MTYWRQRQLQNNAITLFGRTSLIRITSICLKKQFSKIIFRRILIYYFLTYTCSLSSFCQLLEDYYIIFHRLWFECKYFGRESLRNSSIKTHTSVLRPKLSNVFPIGNFSNQLTDWTAWKDRLARFFENQDVFTEHHFLFGTVFDAARMRPLIINTT